MLNTSNKFQITVIISALLFGVLSCMPFIAMVSPRALALAPAITALFLFAIYKWKDGSKVTLSKSYCISAGAIILLSFLSSFWAIDTEYAQERVLKISLIFLGGGLLLPIFSMDEITRSRFFRGAFPVMMVLAGAYCVFEIFTDAYIYKYLREGQDMRVNMSFLNRGTIAFVFFLLPTFVLLKHAAIATRLKKLIVIALILATALIFVLTQSQSAQMAIIILLIFAFIFPANRRAAYVLLGAGICAGILIMPLLVQYLYASFAVDLSAMPWMSDGYAASRLEIWDFVARKALENPLYGHGIEATRLVEKFESPLWFTPYAHILHPHNFVLQVWIEFGLIGAIGLSALLMLLLQKIYKMPKEVRRYAVAVFMSVCAVGCTAYGLWQGYWLGLILFVLCLIVYMAKLTENAGNTKL